MLTEQAKKIADEAKKKGMWLYEPEYKRWYSPEDFKHAYTYASATDKFLSTIQIRHPKEGIEAGFKKLNDLQSKLMYFVKSVSDYYIK